MGKQQQSNLHRVAARESVETFGAEVRELRKARQMTLTDLAKASGVSVSHLSAIERGSVSPTLNKISLIADGLEVPDDWFFARRVGNGPLERSHVVRRGNRRNLNLLYGQTAEEAGYEDTLVSSSLGGAFQMGISDFAPHSETVSGAHFSRDGEQHGYVLQGELCLTLETETITLNEGDGYSFPNEILHSIRNLSDAPARLIWANAPIIIPKYVAISTDGDA